MPRTDYKISLNVQSKYLKKDKILVKLLFCPTKIRTHLHWKFRIIILKSIIWMPYPKSRLIKLGKALWLWDYARAWPMLKSLRNLRDRIKPCLSNKTKLLIQKRFRFRYKMRIKSCKGLGLELNESFSPSVGCIECNIKIKTCLKLKD